MRLLLAALLFLGSASLPARADSGRDPAELQRTWEAAWVFLPSDAAAGYRRTTVAALGAVPAEAAIVLYAHGCDGLGEMAAETGRFLARAGYIAVMPDSFARLDKPVSCRPAQRSCEARRPARCTRSRAAARPTPETRSATGRRRAACR